MRALAVLLLVISGCSTAQPSLSEAVLPSPTPTQTFRPGLIPPAQTWIGVFGPRDSRGFIVLPQELSLEVDGQAWSITKAGGGGVISPSLTETSSVRLVGVGDCHVYAAFDANPGRFYSIRFEDDGSVSINEEDGMDGGPGLGERVGGVTGCE